LHEKQLVNCFNRKPALLTWPLEASTQKAAADNEGALKSVLKREQTLKCGFCAAPSSGKLQSVFKLQSEFKAAGGSTCCGQKVLAPRLLCRTFLCSSSSL